MSFGDELANRGNPSDPQDRLDHEWQAPGDLIAAALEEGPGRMLAASLEAFDDAGCPGVPTWVVDGERFWARTASSGWSTGRDNC